MTEEATPKIGIIMGSQSDWATMQLTADILGQLDITHEVKSFQPIGHRTGFMIMQSQRHPRNLKVIIAGAGGAAHLPGMAAAMTRVPVLGVPIQSRTLNGVDSLLSIAQMPAGIPVGTLAIGDAGAKNAALLAAAILANEDDTLAERLDAWRAAQSDAVAEQPE